MYIDADPDYPYILASDLHRKANELQTLIIAIDKMLDPARSLESALIIENIQGWDRHKKALERIPLETEKCVQAIKNLTQLIAEVLGR